MTSSATVIAASSIVALIGYLGSAALVLARRFRQERRHGRLKRLETTLSNADPAGHRRQVVSRG